MRKSGAAIILTLLFLASAHADLASRFRDEKKNPDKVAWSKLSASLDGSQIVFVQIHDWFFAPMDQFRDNIATLKRDIKASVTTASSSFFRSYDENAQDLNQQVRNIYSQNGNKGLIIIGNPQTGPDALYTVLKNPDLISQGVVKRLILVQPAFGSPAADLVYSGASNSELTAAVTSMFGKKLEKFLTWNALAVFKNAISSLSASDPILLNQISQNLFFARSSSSFLRVTPFPSISVPYLALRPFGATDGISFTENQMLNEIGRDLGVVQADHWDLFVSNPPFSNSLPNYRSSFTRALLMEAK